ncbi:MAG: hypothetical protein R3A79_23415 [Nannocystaceae bacterium]
MRRPALRLLAALCVASGCAHERRPAPPAPLADDADPADPEPTADQAADPATEPTDLAGPVELSLVEGEPQIAEGVEWTLLGASYAHLSEDRNRSQVKLQARRGGETVELRVSRIHPGDAAFTPVWDLEVALKHAGAYNPPVSAVLLVRRAAAP